MKLLALVLFAQFAGCAATTSAVGAIGSALGAKPTQVTVVNQLTVPAPAVVAPHRDATRAIAVAGIGGALAGGLIAASLHADVPAIAGSAALGAGIGAAVGYVAAE